MTSQFLRFAIARGLVCASALASCVVQAGITVNDRVGKMVELCAPDNGLTFCRGSFPTAEGPIVYGWTRENGVLREEVQLPPG